MTVLRKTTLMAASLAILLAGASAQELARVLQAPGPASRGLAWDGQYLWVADVDSLFQVDPTNGTVVKALYFETFEPFGGLAMSEDGNLWLANGPTIYLLDSGTGDMITSFGCPGG